MLHSLSSLYCGQVTHTCLIFCWNQRGLCLKKFRCGGLQSCRNGWLTLDQKWQCMTMRPKMKVIAPKLLWHWSEWMSGISSLPLQRYGWPQSQSPPPFILYCRIGLSSSVVLFLMGWAHLHQFWPIFLFIFKLLSRLNLDPSRPSYFFVLSLID